MKRIAAILLMLLLVFNITGYRFTVKWMQQQQNAGLEKELDHADFDEASLVEISVPLSLPYYNNWQDFERFDGEITIDGITHKYVMRKVQDGKLIVKCLPNPQQQTIQKNVSNLFAQINGLPQQESSSTGLKKILKTGLLEYEEMPGHQLLATASMQILNYLSNPIVALPSQIQPMPWQPPEINGSFFNCRHYYI